MRGGKNACKIIGKKYGRLTVIKNLPSISGRTVWLCLCACGTEKVVNSNLLNTGKTKSCGCFRSDCTSNKFKKHGFNTINCSKEEKNFYKKWKNMHSRCTNKNVKEYKHYGGRGILVEWECFEKFRDDMFVSFIEYLKTHTLKEATIDRINVDGNYCKENCRWATQSTQVKNRRVLTKR